jgi:hypothetical protein
MKQEPVFSVLTGKATGFYADGNAGWFGADGTYCPAGTYDGVNYYLNYYTNEPSGYYMFRVGGYWYIAFTDQPGALYGAPNGYVESNSSTPPLTGWIAGDGVTSLSLTAANC